MKKCAYCGSENPDDVSLCRECGTSTFVEANSSRTPDAGPEPVAAKVTAVVELQRCQDPESLAQITRVLDAAGIEYRRSSLPPMFDLSKIGANDLDPVIISVPRDSYDAARTAMENEYLKLDLPEDHYLLTSTDAELVEIAGQSSEWSAFDVAHAKRLIRERGIDLKKVEEKKADYLLKQKTGRRASNRLIFFGWVFSILGGVIGFGIAWSLAYMKENTPDGEFYTYDEESRTTGKTMLVVAVGVIASAIALRLIR